MDELLVQLWMSDWSSGGKVISPVVAAGLVQLWLRD